MKRKRSIARVKGNIGSAHPAAKITESDVRAIRMSERTLTEIGEIFGVSIAQVHRIRARKSWAHVK